MAVIPAFAHARRNSPVAIVSGDRTKSREIARRYRIEHTFTQASGRQVLKGVRTGNAWGTQGRDRVFPISVRAVRVLLFVRSGSPMSVAASCTSRSPTIRQSRGLRNNSASHFCGTIPRSISSTIAITHFTRGRQPPRRWASTRSSRLRARRGRTLNAERLIGSIRRECLDHVIIANDRGLRRVLRAYVEYDQKSRTHLSLQKDAPVPQLVASPADGDIVPIPHLGGLHQRYERRAA